MKSLARSASTTAILLISSKILGFCREILLADRFGTTYIADAYSVAITLPSVLFTLFASGFAQSYIPSHSRLPTERREQFFSTVCSVLLLISLLVTGLCFYFSKTITDVLAPGFQSEAQELTERFIRAIVFHLPAFTLFNILCAQIQTEEDFFVPSFCDFIVVNIINIAFIMIASPSQPMLIIYGYVVSICVALSILAAYSAKKYRLRFHFTPNPWDADFHSLCALAIPLGISLLVNQFNAVVDRMFSSSLGEGITSALGYADKLQSILLTLTTTIFLQVCYPRMNRYFAAGETEQGMSYARKAAMIACYTSIPLTVLFAVYAEPIVRLIFQRGSFDAASTVYTSVCLRFYALGILFFAVRTILTNVLAANTKQGLILKNTVITVVCNVALNSILVRVMGYAGLALATSLSGLLACILMLRDTRALGLHLMERTQGRELLCICAGTAAALGTSLLLFPLLLAHIGSNAAIILMTALAGLIYITVTVAMKPGILVWMHDHLPAKLQLLRGYYPVSGGEHE